MNNEYDSTLCINVMYACTKLCFFSVLIFGSHSHHSMDLILFDGNHIILV